MYGMVNEFDQKKERGQMIISSESKYTINDVISKIKESKNENDIIITDQNIISDNSNRQLIHNTCEALCISSETIRPMGSSGLFIVITQKIPSADGLYNNDLMIFVRLCAIPIPKNMVKSAGVFYYKMNVINKFHSRYGKPDTPSPNKLFELFRKVKYDLTKSSYPLNYSLSILSEQIIDFITSQESYKRFNREPLTGIKDRTTDRILNNNTSPYKIGVSEGWYISIDIKSANYNILRLYDPRMVGNKETWTEFIKLFTDQEFFQHSKIFRQEVLGKLNSSRIQAKQKELLVSLVKMLNEVDITIDGRINSDELIISTTKEEAFDLCKHIKNILAGHPHPDIWRVEVLCIKPLMGNSISSFYPFVRETFIDEKTSWIKFCCTPRLYMTQVMNFWMGEEIQKGDLVFADEYGNIHSFDYPIVK